MKYILVLGLLLFLSCKDSKSLTPLEIRTGTFKTVLDKSDVESLAYRSSTIQIETYNQKKDTFNIYWKSDFEYILKKVNPKNNLDSTEFIVKITGIHKNSYTFKAYYKGSNYKQKGKAIKVN
jgi:hypothetical protein